jgi:hypothetical protein
MGRGGNNLLYSNSLFTEQVKNLPGQTNIAGLKARQMYKMDNRDRYSSQLITDSKQLGQFNFCDGFNFGKNIKDKVRDDLLNVEKFMSTNNWLALKESFPFHVKWRNTFVRRTLSQRTNQWVDYLIENFQSEKYLDNKLPYQLVPIAFTFSKKQDLERGLVAAYPYKQDKEVSLEQILPEQKLTENKRYSSGISGYDNTSSNIVEDDPENDFFHSDLENRSSFVALSSLASVEDFINQKNAKWYWAPDLSLMRNIPVLPHFPGMGKSSSAPIYSKNQTLLYVSSHGRVLGAAWAGSKENIIEQQDQVNKRVPFIPERKKRK